LLIGSSVPRVPVRPAGHVGDHDDARTTGVLGEAAIAVTVAAIEAYGGVIDFAMVADLVPARRA
jgi:hypothetical protein